MDKVKTELNRILIKGGVISPSELLQVIDLVKACDLDYFHFGSRQDILFPKNAKLEEVSSQFPELKIEELSSNKYHNIVSSYVSTNILPSTAWLNSTIYLYILEQIHFLPELKINITDPQQRLVPLFTGNLNFIASKHPDYWYLHVDLPAYPPNNYYPALIHTWNVATIAQAIQENYKQTNTIPELFDRINQKVVTQNRTMDKGLVIQYEPFPYYEGMNRMNLDEYWLGLYWRNNQYDLHFLQAMCELCSECKIGKICITPWKSFIVKGIHESYKIPWEKFLGKYGINVRHSSLELNWHIPVNDPEALELKRFMVRNFDQNDISTYGLTFGIGHTQNTRYFTAIVIVKNPTPELAKKYHIRPTYNVQYSRDFDPNTCEYITYAQDVDKVELPGLVMELSRLYFEQLGKIRPQENTSTDISVASPKNKNKLFQCSACLSVYDPAYGEPSQNIPPNTSFENLPPTFVCPVCEAPKSSFRSKII